ncbi:MAG: DUF354 domain-containing protein [Candidatus Nitrosotenuis sp.]
MKIWFDILTPKQILFFEPMIRRLRKNNLVMCTTRNYREVNELSKLKNLKLVVVGKHGGNTKSGKLDASLKRSVSLSSLVEKFKPDVLVSFCSPEASRVGFGLGIRHYAFCDSPHAEAVMKLSIPFVDKLLIPWIISKNEFTRYGIKQRNIITYKAIDASVIVRNAIRIKRQKNKRKTILIRVEEEYAAYAQKNNHSTEIIQKILENFPQHNILVLPRYKSQIEIIRKTVKGRIKILNKAVIGSEVLQKVDVFIGSGGTMTAEAALLGIPTISYNAVPNLIQNFLVRKKLVNLESNPDKIISLISKFLVRDNNSLQKNAQKTLISMEDPYKKLNQLIREK